MSGDKHQEPAVQPDDLARFFVERANAGDVDGLVALYEPDAVLTFPPGHIAAGGQAIRAVYEKLLAGRPALAVEVARRQPDGTWLWAIDRFNILE